jgi:pimeloyl-ACP methyl ester carboxylesterase
MRILLFLLIAYSLVVAAAFLFQRKLLYMPTCLDMPSLQPQAARLGVTLWNGPGKGYRALLSEPAVEKNKTPTVIVFHGNAGSAMDRMYYVDALKQRGLRVLLVEYPGYGARPGQPSEKALVSDARNTIRAAHETFGAPLYLWGESLGAAVVACAVADLDVPVPGLVLLTPWDNLPNTAQAAYPFLPARWLVKDRYDSIAALSNYAGRVAVIMAGKDEIIPNRLTLKLLDAIRTEKRHWLFENAGHNSWPWQPQLSWWDQVWDFVSGSIR